MELRSLRPYRTPLIGALVALTVGVTGGLLLRTGSQIAPGLESYAPRADPYAEAEPIAWPGGKVPDYVIGTDFLQAQQTDQPPVVVASYQVPEYVPPAWHEPEPPAPPQPAQPAGPADAERAWPSTGGDILDIRLPEDHPVAPEAPRPPEAPAAVTAQAALAVGGSPQP
jgi:hypothetical protein